MKIHVSQKNPSNQLKSNSDSASKANSTITSLDNNKTKEKSISV